MRYKLFGTTGCRVSELALGTMTFGADWGWGADKRTSQQIFDTFAIEGGTFVDTANLYTNGTAEEYVGEFTKSDREHFVIATKYSLTPRPNQGDNESIRPNESGNSRKSMMQAVEASLKRLQTDYIDILYLHAWDYMTPVEEVMRGLDDLVRQGKVLYAAASDTPAYVVSEAITLAKVRGWSPFVAVQAPYNLLRRDLEREIIPMARHHGIAVTPWGILASGVLTGKFRKPLSRKTRVDPDKLKLTERDDAIVDAVLAVADQTGKTPAQVVVNWLRQNGDAQIIPILGATKLDQFTDQMAALEWELSEEQITRLNEVSKPDLGFPHDFLPGNRFLFGNTFPLIDDHRGESPRP